MLCVENDSVYCCKLENWPNSSKKYMSCVEFKERWLKENMNNVSLQVSGCNSP